MDRRAYWIWLQHAFGEGSPMPWRIHRSLPGGVEEFCESGPRMWNTLSGIRAKAAGALYRFSPVVAPVTITSLLPSSTVTSMAESCLSPIAGKAYLRSVRSHRRA